MLRTDVCNGKVKYKYLGHGITNVSGSNKCNVFKYTESSLARSIGEVESIGRNGVKVYTSREKGKCLFTNRPKKPPLSEGWA